MLAHRLFVAPFVRFGDVEKVNLHAIQNIGLLLGQVAWAQPSDTDVVSPEYLMAVATLRRTLVSLLTTYPELMLSRRQANKLIDDIDRWYNTFTAQLAGGDPIDLKERVTTDDLVAQARSFSIILDEELEQLTFFRMTKKRAYNIFDLLEYADRVFADDVRANLSEDALYDVRQCGRSLAFECPTAAGFHVLRALELVMHDYYLAVCQPSQKHKLKSWGVYIKALEKNKGTAKGGADVDKVVALLKEIKDHDRNLIFHPNARLDMDEAFELFQLATNVIMTMSRRLPDAKREEEASTGA